jgi:hypothetical protein
MRTLKVFVTFVTICGVAAPVAGGDLLGSVPRVVARMETQAPAEQRAASKAVWPGAALFVGGIAVALNGFLNNRNGEFPEFGEAESTNIKMGTAGLAAAFGGGVLLYFGSRGAVDRPVRSVTVAAGRVTVSKSLRW